MNGDFRRLGIELMVHADHAPISPRELRTAAEWADGLARDLVTQEGLRFLDQSGTSLLDLPLSEITEPRFSPAEIDELRRGSIALGLDVAAIGALAYLVKKFLLPPIEEAWAEAAPRESLKAFFRDQIFGGRGAWADGDDAAADDSSERLAQQVARYVIETPPSGPMTVNAVQVEATEDGMRITVELRRTSTPAEEDARDRAHRLLGG